jgi:hypothetical protein
MHPAKATVPLLAALSLPVLMYLSSCGNPNGSGVASGPPRPHASPVKSHPTVRAFLNEYFRSWNEADFYAYEACFDRGAVIQYRSPSGKLTEYDLPAFIRGQATVHRKGDGKTEVPLSMDIRMEEGLARCLVRWKLTRPDGSRIGYDEFVLEPEGDSWRIVSLLFYYE